ncbi:protein S100-A16-like [Megalops cyprinoides]|uniref:protein S100-A16-like n=1 Tax=Megalops cyprinoides TaxID=118141 RepID=UPI001863AA8E|nr:protein S100-A16-like [Megalops cyprinoides]
MESAIQTVVGVFLKSAKGKESLGGKDFQNLVKSQLHNIMTDTDSSEAVKEMRQGLDANQDGKVSFQEYMTLVGYLANMLSQQRTVAQEKPAEKEEVVEDEEEEEAT